MKKRIPKRTSPRKVQINGPIVARISGLKFVGIDMAKEGERDKSYAYFVNSVKKRNSYRRMHAYSRRIGVFESLGKT